MDTLFIYCVQENKFNSVMNHIKRVCWRTQEVFWPRHLVTDHRKVLLNYSSPQGQMFIMPQLITATTL